MGTPVESGGGTVTESGLGGGSTESGAGGGGGAVESPPGGGGTIVSGVAGIESGGERESIGTSGASEVTGGASSPQATDEVRASPNNAPLKRSVRRRRAIAPVIS